MYVIHAPQSLLGAWFGPALAGTRFTAMGWPIDAGGLTEELIHLRNADLYVTENGACYEDPLAASGVVHDDDRVAYLRDYLAAARNGCVSILYFFSMLEDAYWLWVAGMASGRGVRAWLEWRPVRRGPAWGGPSAMSVGQRVSSVITLMLASRPGPTS
jgi:hypothetical protein